MTSCDKMSHGELKIESIHTSIQEPGIKASVWYGEDNDISLSLRKKAPQDYEMWICADVSRMGEKYYENYTCVFMTKEQLIELRNLIDEKLKEE